MQTDIAHGTVWPRDGGIHGPHDLVIGVRSQPPIIRDWGKGVPILFNLEQPRETDNFTLVRVMFLKPGARTPDIVKGMKFKTVRQYRNKGGEMKVRIKVRFTNSLPHPLPKGRYTGTVMYDDAGRFAVLTLQAVTLRKEPEPSKPKTIITPGDPEFNESLANAERTLHGTDGVAR